jgi:hypothetical protein
MKPEVITALSVPDLIHCIIINSTTPGKTNTFFCISAPSQHKSGSCTSNHPSTIIFVHSPTPQGTCQFSKIISSTCAAHTFVLFVTDQMVQSSSWCSHHHGSQFIYFAFCLLTLCAILHHASRSLHHHHITPY